MMTTGFSKANSGNLPIVDSMMVANFFSGNENFVGAELKGVKMARSGRVTYGDSAVGYVQLKREDKSCIVRARVTPEHRVRQKCYVVEVVVDEESSSIKEAKCMDCTAAQGGCKHAVAALMWLHRRSEEPAPTETVCYWKKSRLSDVGSNLKFMHAVDLSTSKERSAPRQSQGVDFLSKFLTTGKKLNERCLIVTHFSGPSDLDKLSLNYLSEKFYSGGVTGYEEFYNFCREEMEDDACLRASQATKSQANSVLCQKLRFGRLTASKIYDAAHCKTIDGTLVESLLGAKVLQTPAMKRGLDLESEVLKEVEKTMKINFESVGLFLSKQEPFLGASPDAISQEYVVEIKCPSNDRSVANYILENGNLSPKCKAQIQLQMHLSGKEKGLFCVAAPDFELTKKVIVIEVFYDCNYTQEIISTALSFWKLAVFPKLRRKL